MKRIFLKSNFKKSAVMICIIRINNEDYFLLEKRAKNIRQGGEISFPGGRRDEADKNFCETALRESIEELGLKKDYFTNIEKFGTLISLTANYIECYMSKLEIDDLKKLDNYNKDEVEKLLLVPIKFFMEAKPIIEEVERYNKPMFDIKKYNFPERYNEWKIQNRKIAIFQYNEETIWGLTAEIIMEFIDELKEKGKVGSYEYK